MAMEKSAKSKNTLLKFLPKAASAVTFQDKRLENAQKLKSHIGKGFSAPMTISIIPVEARRRSKNSGSFISHEPTSPKVSCMGQIKKNKHKNKNQKPKKSVSVTNPQIESKKKQSIIGNFFGKPGRKSDVSADKSEVKGRGASLSQIKRFSSSRDRFANFDWTAQIAPVDSDQHDEFSDEEVIVPYSAPILINGGIALEPKKEVNLWKRRTMAQPPPLQLNPMAVSN